MELTVWFLNYQWNGEMREFDDKHAFFNFYKSTVLKHLYGRRNEGIVEAEEGMLVIKLPHFTIPLIVRKSDGKFHLFFFFSSLLVTSLFLLCFFFLLIIFSFYSVCGRWRYSFMIPSDLTWATIHAPQSEPSYTCVISPNPCFFSSYTNRPFPFSCSIFE